VRESLPRHLKIGLIVLLVGTVITFGLFVDVIGRIQSMVQNEEVEENPFTPSAQPLYQSSDPPMQVKLFFPSIQGETILAVEEQTIFRSRELTNRAKQIVQKLLEGPKTLDFFPSIPKEAKLLEIFIDDTGLAYVDFSDPISANHPGGILNELATVYSIVNSITYNLPEIRQVKILVGGAERETLAGHCLLLPLGMDLSITSVAPKPGKVAELIHAR
jgi:spore germination protein GerM